LQHILKVGRIITPLALEGHAPHKAHEFVHHGLPDVCTAAEGGKFDVPDVI